MITSSVAVEGMNVEVGRDVVVADTPEQFVEAIVALHDDEAHWSETSRRGQLICLQVVRT